MAGRVFAGDADGLTYTVVTEELVLAAASVRAITDSAAHATIETVTEVISAMGHSGLHVAFRDYCARWDTGLSHLVGDGTTMATRLVACADAYLSYEATAEDAYRGVRSCAATTAPPPPVAAQG